MKVMGMALWGVLLAVVVGVGGEGQSQAGRGRTILLRLNELPRRVARDNLVLQMQRLDLQYQSRESKKVAASWMPQLVYQGNFVRNLERPEFVFNINGTEQRFRIGSRYNYLHSLQLVWPIFSGGERWHRWQGQRWQYRSLEASLAGREAGAIRDALRLYFSILLSEESVRARQAARRTALENLRQVRALFAEGAATVLDTLRASAQAAATLPPLLDARTQQHRLRQQLKQLLDLDPADSLVLADSLVAMDYLQRLGSPPLEQLQAWALSHRPELKALQASRQVSRQQRKAVVAQFLPRISFTYTLDQQAQVNQFIPDREDYVRAQRAGVSLQWTLFQGGIRAHTLQQARIREKQLGLQQRQLRRQILLEVESAYQDWQQARAQLASLRARYQQAREAYRLARLYFQEGQATQLEVLAAQSELTASRLALAEGIFQLNVSQIQLLYATGRLKDIWP
ncbi:MAG: TolC family protein [Calditrichaeota bacterium]|nr:MAG: TolC family protein [Calditrichota bacterium]